MKLAGRKSLLLSVLLCVATGVAAVFALPAAQAADPYTLEKAALASPEEVAAPVRATLSGEALRITGPKGPMCEIWLRKALPAAAAPSQGLGVGYGQIAQGALVGVVNLANRAMHGIFVDEDVERVRLLGLVISLVATQARLADRMLETLSVS